MIFINLIFSALIVLSIIASFFTGTVNETMNEGLNSAKKSIEILLSFAGIMCMWSGFLEVAKEGGALDLLTKMINPILNLLFPKLKNQKEAKKQISANISANLLGVGNAATPAGINAMCELDKINKNPLYASEEMCIFTVINSASIQLVPTTIIAIRSGLLSKNPMSVILPIWISSAVSLVLAVLLMKLILKYKKIPPIKK